MSLTDKISNGLVVVLVETFAPCGSYSNDNAEGSENYDPDSVCPIDEEEKKGAYYKNLMSFGIGAIAILGFLSLLVVILQKRFCGGEKEEEKEEGGAKGKQTNSNGERNENFDEL